MRIEISSIKDGAVRRFLTDKGARVYVEYNEKYSNMGFLQITFPIISSFNGMEDIIPITDFTWTRNQEVRYDNNWNELPFPKNYLDPKQNWQEDEDGKAYLVGKTQFELWKEKGMEGIIEIVLKKMIENGEL